MKKKKWYNYRTKERWIQIQRRKGMKLLYWYR